MSKVEIKQIRQRIGTLKVIKKVIWSSPDSYYWVCQCDCGNVRTVEERRMVEETVTMCISCEIRNNKRKLNVNFY